MLIPLFNLVWHFIVVTNIARSLANEYAMRRLPMYEREPGKGIGLAMCILAACGIIPVIGLFTWLAGLVCWIIYWVKISGYSRRLVAPIQYGPPPPPPIQGATSPWG
jgi:hypothetical protein